MTTEPRLLQVFLARRGHGVYEVSVDLGSKTLSCTCPGYGIRRRCKHATWVEEQMHDGGYCVRVPTAAVAALNEALGDPVKWRRVLARYCTPQVL